MLQQLLTQCHINNSQLLFEPEMHV